jgi:AcrR family transcriptional regulator
MRLYKIMNMTEAAKKLEERYEEKEKIMEYAHSRFVAEGFFRTTMDELANELGISKKTIYKYFPSKEKLVEEIAESIINQTTCDMKDVIDAETDVVSKFVKILDVYNSKIIRCSEKWYRDLQLHAPHIWKRIEKVRSEKIYDSLGKLIKQGKREGLIEGYPPEIVITSFIAMVRSVMNPEFVSQNKFTMKEAFEYSFEMLLNGILTTQGKEKYLSQRRRDAKTARENKE